MSPRHLITGVIAPCAIVFANFAHADSGSSAFNLMGQSADASGLGVSNGSSAAWANQLASVDPTTGHASSHLEIDAPSPRGRSRRPLSLTYNSTSGDSDAGAGWSLGVHSITRKSAAGLPTPGYRDPAAGDQIDPAVEDRFYFDGNALIPVCYFGSATACTSNELQNAPPPEQVGAGWHFFRLEVERGAATRFFWSVDHNTWLVQSKSGETLELGVPLDGNYDTTNGIDVELLQHSPWRAIARWRLVRQYDSVRLTGGAPANPIVYTWSPTPASVLSDVYDTPLPGGAWPPLADYANHIHVNTEAYPYARAVSPAVWRRTPSVRISGIDVTSAVLGPKQPRQVVRRYYLRYFDADHHSYLTGFQMEGRCDTPASENAIGTLSATACGLFPATEMKYESGDPAVSVVPGRSSFTVLGTSEPQNWALIDYNSDGLPDLVEASTAAAGGSQSLYLNSSSGTPNTLTYQALGVTLAANGATAQALLPNAASAFTGNFLGDGVPDILWVGSPLPISAYAIGIVSDQTTGQDSADAPAIPWNLAIFSASQPPNGNVYAWTNVGGGTWQWPARYPQHWAAVGDINGDGLLDEIVLRADLATNDPGSGDVGFASLYWSTDFSVEHPDGTIDPFGFRLTNPLVTKPGLQCQVPYDIYQQDHLAPANPPWVHQLAEANGNAPDGKPWLHSAISLADMDGDGLADIAMANETGVEYFPGHGDGWFGAGSTQCLPNATGGISCSCGAPAASVTMTGTAPLTTPSQSQVYFHDITGDGLADFVLVQDGVPSIYINYDGHAFLPFSISAADIPYWAPSSDGTYPIAFGDMNGSGVDDVVFAGRVISYIDLLEGRRGGLLTNVVSPLQATTSIEYATIAQLDVAARASSTPWQSHTPQSDYVVTQVTTTNGVTDPGRSISRVGSYTYANPVFEARQNVFRGFQYVRSTREGDGTVGALTTATTYVVGACPTEPGDACPEGLDNPYEAIQGFPVLVEVSDANGRYLSTAHAQYQMAGMDIGLDSRVVRRAQVEQTDTWLYDLPGKPTTAGVTDIDSIDDGALTIAHPITIRSTSGTQHLRTTTQYDSVGNEALNVDLGRIEGGAPDQAIAVSRTWTLVGPAGSWLWQPSRQTTGYYSGSGFVGQTRAMTYAYYPTGDLSDAIGNLSGSGALARHTTDPSGQPAPSPVSSMDGPVTVAHYEYDGQGNVLLIKGAGGRCIGFTYASDFDDLPTNLTTYAGNVPVGGCGDDSLTVIRSYDRGLGKPTMSISPSNAVTSMTYDGFGRLSQLREPNEDTPGVAGPAVSLGFQYEMNVAVGYSLVRTARTTTSRAAQGAVQTPVVQDVVTYIDGFGNPVVTLSAADPSAGDGGNWVVSGVVDRSASGLVVSSYQPSFFTGSATGYAPATEPLAPFETISYDSFSRPVQRIGFDHSLQAQIVYHPLSRDYFDGEDLRVGGSHYGTPTTATIDGHGRNVLMFEYIGSGAGQDRIATATQYLATGEVVSVSRSHSADSDVYTRTMQYDSLGRMVANIEPNTSEVNAGITSSWRYVYNDAGDVVGTSDARGCGENIFYDGAGRKIAEDYSPCLASQAPYTLPETSHGDGTEAFYVYGPSTGPVSERGKLLAVLDRASLNAFEYDARGRVTRTTKLLARNDAIPASSLQARYATWEFHQTFQYDAADNPIGQTTGADVAGLEAVGGTGTSSVSTQYSVRGLPQSVGGDYGTLVPSIAYTADGRLSAQTYGDVARTTSSYSYNSMRQLTALATSRTAPALWQSGAPGYVRPTSHETLPLLLDDTTITAIDNVGNPLQIADLRTATEWPAGAQPIARKLTYDDLYRLTDVTYASGNDTFASPVSGVANALPQLRAPGRVGEQSYTHDFLGNLTSSSDDQNVFFDRSVGTIGHGGWAPGANGPSNPYPNRISSASRTQSPTGDFVAPWFDNAGNTASLVVQRTSLACSGNGGACTHRFDYDWDEVGHLARARRWDFVGLYPRSEPPYPAHPATTAAIDMRFVYDAGGQRVLKATSVEGAAATYSAVVFSTLRLDGTAWDGQNYGRSAATETPYLASGAGIVGRVISDSTLPSVGGNTQHVFLELADRLGSTSTVIDMATSELVERSTYLAYGTADSEVKSARWESFRERYRFTAHEDDVEIGLTYFGARYYSAQLGHWLSPDPLAIHAVSGDLNPYAYVRGSPLRLIDPLGLDEGDPTCSGTDCNGGASDGYVVTNQWVGADGVTNVIFGLAHDPDDVPPTFVAPPPPEWYSIADLSERLEQLTVTFDTDDYGKNLINKSIQLTASTLIGGAFGGPLNPGVNVLATAIADRITAPLTMNVAPTINGNNINVSGAAATGTIAALQIIVSAGIGGVMAAVESAEGAAVNAAAEGVETSAEDAADVPATFIGQESGPSIVVPDGATGPTPTNNGLGVQYTGGAGGPGLSPNTSSVRIMEPTAPAGRSLGYPSGYASYSNASNQAINPLSGQTVARSSEWWHLSL